MKIAVTGATGFIGHYIVRQLLAAGHQLVCWRRDSSDVSGLPEDAETLQWLAGELGDLLGGGGLCVVVGRAVETPRPSPPKASIII